MSERKKQQKQRGNRERHLETRMSSFNYDRKDRKRRVKQEIKNKL